VCQKDDLNTLAFSSLSSLPVANISSIFCPIFFPMPGSRIASAPEVTSASAVANAWMALR
jgi:hypothetical protein